MIHFVFHFRPFSWFFEKTWYSLCRWKNPQKYEGWRIRLIDIGAITIGYRKKDEEV